MVSIMIKISLVNHHWRSLLFFVMTVVAVATKAPIKFLDNGSHTGIIFFWTVSAAFIGLAESHEMIMDYVPNQKTAKTLNTALHGIVYTILAVFGFLVFI